MRVIKPSRLLGVVLKGASFGVYIIVWKLAKVEKHNTSKSTSHSQAHSRYSKVEKHTQTNNYTSTSISTITTPPSSLSLPPKGHHITSTLFAAFGPSWYWQCGLRFHDSFYAEISGVSQLLVL